MTIFSLINFAVLSAFAVIFLFLGTFFLLFLERFVTARAQHRDGPGRNGEVDYLQVFWDYLKVRNKSGSGAGFQIRFKIIFELWRLLPFIFIWVLVSGRAPTLIREAEIPLLVLLIVISAVTETILLNATEEQKEKYDLKQVLMLKIIGATNLLFCILTVVLNLGSFDLAAASISQTSLPFLSLLSSPGKFLAGISAFCSIYLITASGPVKQEEDISLKGSWHYTFFFVRRMWIFCLVAFWAFLFLGGSSGLFIKLLFPVKIAFMLLLFFVLQISVPQSRIADAEALAIRWLLPVSLFAFLFEIIWMGAMQ